VKIQKGGPEPERMSFGGGVLLPDQESGKVAVAASELEPVPAGV